MITFTLYGEGSTLIAQYTNVISVSIVNTFASVIYSDSGTVRTVIHKMVDAMHYTLTYVPIA